MKKFLPLILTVLMFSGLFTACDSGVITETLPLPLETFNNTTLTTGENGEREEIADAEEDFPAFPDLIFDSISYKTDYANASNTALGGDFATDDYNIYYSNKIDKGNIYKKGFEEEGAGTKIADAGPSGNLRSISIWNGYIHYITDDGTEWNAYKMPLDGSSEPFEAFHGIGSYYSVSDNIQVFTLPDGGLYAERLDGDGGARLIDDSPIISFVHFTGGEVTYYNGEAIKVYNLVEETFSFVAPVTSVGAMIRDGVYIYYQIDYRTFENSWLSETLAINVNTMEKIDISAGQINLNVTPDDEYYSGQEYISTGFNVFNFKFYYNVYRDYSDGGFKKRVTYSKDMITLQITEELNYYYDAPVKDFYGLSSNTLYKTPFGLYEYNRKGELENIGLVMYVPPATVISDDTEYMAAANSVFYGQFAFDDTYIYYENLNDNHNLYKKRFDSDDAGVKLADANVYGHIYGICAYGDEVFYVTRYYDPKTATGTDGGGGVAYAVKKDGSSTEPRVVIEGVGDNFYVYDGVIYYTGGISSLNEAQLLSVPLEGGTPEIIAEFAMYMSIADGLITYHNGKNIFSYDIASKGTAIHIGIDNVNAIDSMFRYGDYIIYHINNNIAVYDINAGSYELLGVVDGVNIIMPMSYNIFEGLLNYFTYGDRRDDGFYSKNLYGYNLTEKKYDYEGLEESRAPYYTDPPECAMFSTPNGIYTYGTDGNLEKYIFPSL
jgi:hypothetical protein